MDLKIVFVASILFFGFSLQTTLGYQVTCENLDKDTCAFAVSSAGKRCVLEKSVKRSGLDVYTCRTSEIEAETVTNIIESNECITSCGLDRKSLGISSDALLETRFTQKLCSSKCLIQCPNIVDLFFNLAAGEGVFLPKLCEEEQKKPRRREMSEMEALAPIGSLSLTTALAPEPYTN